MISGSIINLRRCGLGPVRAEKLIVSAVRHRSQLRKVKKPLIIPSFRILKDQNDGQEVESDEDTAHEREKIETEAWAAFFEQDQKSGDY